MQSDVLKDISDQAEKFEKQKEEKEGVKKKMQTDVLQEIPKKVEEIKQEKGFFSFAWIPFFRSFFESPNFDAFFQLLKIKSSPK